MEAWPKLRVAAAVRRLEFRAGTVRSREQSRLDGRTDGALYFIMNIRRLSVLILASLAPAFVAAAAEPTLKVIGPSQTLTLSAADFAALPHVTLDLPAQGAQGERHFSGVPMREILARVGAPIGDKTRGAGLMSGVIVRCKDNYAVLFALAEFDPNYTNRTIILADKEDGDMLPPSAAPYRIVTPGDKHGARSCKQVVAIEVVSLAKQ
jgi:hypothetical protein